MEINLNEELLIAQKICIDAGKQLKNSYNRPNILSNNDRDIKLKQDIDTNQKIINALLKHSSVKHILSEENSNKDIDQKGFYWIVDPLDGSYNYYRNIDICCTSMALWNKDTPVIGITYDFIHDELYYNSVSEEKSFCNGQIITGPSEKKFNQLCIASGIPSQLQLNSESINKYFTFLTQFKKVRFFGSAAMSLCLLAKGKVDIYYEKEIFIWDIASGLKICSDAGIKFNLKHLGSYKVEVIACNKKVLNQIADSII